MRRLLVALVCLIALAIMITMRSRITPSPEQPHSASLASAERSPVCPWREPSHDLSVLFPAATNFLLETRILSSLIVPIRKQLGRDMTVDENPLRVFRVRREDQSVGSILVCRVKGIYGGIEIVTGVSTNGTVNGVLIQSQREPDTTASEITNSAWLRSFVGRNSSSPMRVGEDIRAVPAEARATAQAIANGVRSQLIVLSFAEQLVQAATVDSHALHH